MSEDSDGQSKGGRTTVMRHGSEHMREIGRRGGLKTAATHDMGEIGAQGGQATVEAHGADHMRKIGHNGGRGLLNTWGPGFLEAIGHLPPKRKRGSS